MFLPQAWRSHSSTNTMFLCSLKANRNSVLSLAPSSPASFLLCPHLCVFLSAHWLRRCSDVATTHVPTWRRRSSFRLSSSANSSRTFWPARWHGLPLFCVRLWQLILRRQSNCVDDSCFKRCKNSFVSEMEPQTILASSVNARVWLATSLSFWHDVLDCIVSSIYQAQWSGILQNFIDWINVKGCTHGINSLVLSRWIHMQISKLSGKTGIFENARGNALPQALRGRGGERHFFTGIDSGNSHFSARMI